MKNIKDICEVDRIIPIHQLNKINEKGTERQNFFPISVVQAIFDKTGIRLDAIISSFNYLFLPWKGTKEATRLQVVGLMRRKSLVICYRDLDDNTTIEMYNSNERGDNEWKKDNNWKDWIAWLKEVVEEIFKNMDNYPNFEQTIKDIVNTWITENLGDYIKNVVDEYLNELDLDNIINNVFGDIILNHPEYITNVVNNYLTENLEPLVGEYFTAIVKYLRDNERVIANALTRHEQAITELQNT